ncbi:MAG: acetyl-CoA carboxylase, biotin carboxyl carrier protein [Lachnospiraceae bacterium]|nr:acetyl-CoA carboxylase, biotin carboxyl carrier protein [Lachnospiraceae bacterium]
MNIKDVYDLLDRFENSNISELQLEIDGAKLMCKKNSEEPEYKVVRHTKEPEEKTVDATNGIEVKAKIAGTFYRAPSPESEPFVQVGQKVKKGDVIGLIEAMKIMNDIVAPEDGVVSQIVASNEELVSFDDVLIVIDGGK